MKWVASFARVVEAIVTTSRIAKRTELPKVKVVVGMTGVGGRPKALVCDERARREWGG